jgi:hypothetical protein
MSEQALLAAISLRYHSPKLILLARPQGTEHALKQTKKLLGKH